MNAQHSTAPAAFTLVELLLVIAIIAVLAALLLSALARAKGRAQQIACISNQRQLSLTWLLYASDNREVMVPNGNGEKAVRGLRLWVFGGSHFFPPAMTDPRYLLDTKLAAFGDYLESVKIYKCPADHCTITDGNATVPKTRSYAMNDYLGPIEPEYVPKDYRYFTKMAHLLPVQLDKIFLFQDVLPENLCLSAFVVPMSNSQGFFHFPSSQHLNSGVIAFADGHVQSHRWVDERTRPQPLGDNFGHYTVSPNNLDLAWLREHATCKK